MGGCPPSTDLWLTDGRASRPVSTLGFAVFGAPTICRISGGVLGGPKKPTWKAWKNEAPGHQKRARRAGFKSELRTTWKAWKAWKNEAPGHQNQARDQGAQKHNMERMSTRKPLLPSFPSFPCCWFWTPLLKPNFDVQELNLFMLSTLSMLFSFHF